MFRLIVAPGRSSPQFQTDRQVPTFHRVDNLIHRVLPGHLPDQVKLLRQFRRHVVRREKKPRQRVQIDFRAVPRRRQRHPLVCQIITVEKEAEEMLKGLAP